LQLRRNGVKQKDETKMPKAKNGNFLYPKDMDIIRKTDGFQIFRLTKKSEKRRLTSREKGAILQNSELIIKLLGVKPWISP
jgi:hypothetical protein